jgi:hypothetical protein
MATLLVAPQLATANDSTASLDTGGLHLTYNADIRINSEELHLGPREVTVAYEFENTSSRDINTLVAFPLPVMEIGEGGNYDFAGNDPVNIIDFRVSAGAAGVLAPIEPSIEIRASRFGVDVTEVLRRHGIPPTMNVADGAALQSRLDDLEPAARAELERYGLVDWSSVWGANEKPLANTHWQTQISYYWFQTFPAHRTLRVTHSYHPVPRRFIFGSADLDDARMKREFCFDKAFIAGGRKRLAASPTGVVSATELKYVLTSGSNWLGPIGRLHLIIEKPSTEAVVSLCGEGLARSGPTTFELTRERFEPNDDIRVLFLESLPKDF